MENITSTAKFFKAEGSGSLCLQFSFLLDFDLLFVSLQWNRPQPWSSSPSFSFCSSRACTWLLHKVSTTDLIHTELLQYCEMYMDLGFFSSPHGISTLCCLNMLDILHQLVQTSTKTTYTVFCLLVVIFQVIKTVEHKWFWSHVAAAVFHNVKLFYKVINSLYSIRGVSYLAQNLSTPQHFNTKFKLCRLVIIHFDVERFWWILIKFKITASNHPKRKRIKSGEMSTEKWINWKRWKICSTHVL